MEKQKLYLVEEIAAYFGVHKNTVLNWIKDNKLKCIKLSGRTIRISQEQLDEFILESENNG